MANYMYIYVSMYICVYIFICEYQVLYTAKAMYFYHWSRSNEFVSHLDAGLICFLIYLALEEPRA